MAQQFEKTSKPHNGIENIQGVVFGLRPFSYIRIEKIRGEENGPH